MSSYADKFSSDYLTSEEAMNALNALPEVLKRLLGESDVIARFGFDVNLHSDLSWVPMRDRTSTLQYFIEDIVAQGIIIPGKNDVFFEIPGERLTIHFCHEGDIHVNGQDDDLIRAFLASAPFSELRFESKEELQARSPRAPVTYTKDPDHPIIDQPWRYSVIGCDYHCGADGQTHLDLLLQLDSTIRRLRFINVIDIHIRAGFPRCKGLLIKDVSGRASGNSKIYIQDENWSGGIVFWAQDVIDLDV